MADPKTTTPAKNYKIGLWVDYVDAAGYTYPAFVTWWSDTSGSTVPLCHVAYVATDEKQMDNNGRVIERACSVPHMTSPPTPGTCYWKWPDE